MVEKINTYLEQPIDERDYDEGLLLLSKASKNRVLIQRLSRKEWAEKLFYELGKIVQYEQDVIEYNENLLKMQKAAIAKKTAKTRAANKKKKEEEAAKLKEQSENAGQAVDLPEEFSEANKPTRLRVVKGDQKINFDELPEGLQAKWTKNAEMYKEARSLHEKLKLMKDASDEERKPIVTRLGQLSEAVRANWNKIDNYDPSKEKEPKKTVEIDHKRISANRKYISSNLKKLEDKPENKKLHGNIQERITELVTAGITFSADQEARLKKLKFDMNN